MSNVGTQARLIKLGRVVEMTNVGDILRLTACQNIFDQRVCNVFYYLVGVWTGNKTYKDILDSFEADVIPSIASIQSDELTWDLLELDNVTNGVEFFQKNIDIQGDGIGTPAMPSYVSVGVKLLRSTKVTRNGSKRIAGIQEGNVTDNNVDLNQVGIDAVQDAMVLDLTDDINTPNFVLEPVIVGRQPNGSLDLARINPIASAQVKPLITTQNSRKQRA